jgi:hypothetical protein
MDWATDLGEPRDPAVAMDPGVGVEPDLDDEAFGLRPVIEPEPAVPRTAAPVRRFLLAGLVVILGLAVAVALTLVLARAIPPHPARTGAAGAQACCASSHPRAEAGA